MNMRNHKLMLCSVLVAMLAIAGCGQSGTAPESAAEGDGGKATTAGGAASAPARQAAPKFESIVLPAGTSIEVTVDQAVSSKTNNAGDSFAASLAAPVMVDGKQVIAKGSAVSGRVTDAKSAGRFKGNAALSLTLASVTVDGKEYDLKTSTHTEATASRGKRTAITTGIGAAAGAAIGAIAGGGKGAAIGAGAGAGAGATGAAVTGERDVDIPAETKVDFKLSQPVTVQVPLS
jgi:hypothetical protein